MAYDAQLHNVKVSGEFQLLSGCEFKDSSGNDILTQIDALTNLSTTELGYIDGVTAGTVTASKAVVVDANKDVGDLRNLDVQNLDAGASGTAGTVDVFPSTASKGKLILACADNTTDHNMTITNAAVNGASVTVTVPALTGFAALSTAALTLAEVDVLDAVTAGTVAASKAVVVDANKDVSSFRDITVRQVFNTGNIGAVAGTGVAATEYGDGTIHQTVLTFTDVDVALADEAGTIAYGGLKVYDFPEGAVLILGAVADIDLTKSSAGVNDDWDGDFAVGTATAGNDADLTSTEADIIAKTATPQAVAGATTANGGNAAVAFLDGTATAKDAYVNFLVDDADHDVTTTACNLIMNGTLTLTWCKIGDY